MVKYSDIDAELQSLIKCSEFFLAMTYNHTFLRYKVTKVFMDRNWSWFYCNQMLITASHHIFKTI